MIDYLQAVTKHRAMTVEIFVQRLKTLARSIEALPYTCGSESTHFDHDENQKYRLQGDACTLAGTICMQPLWNRKCYTLLELQNFMANEKNFSDGSYTVTHLAFQTHQDTVEPPGVDNTMTEDRC
jgi:hypothetical protein